MWAPRVLAAVRVPSLHPRGFALTTRASPGHRSYSLQADRFTRPATLLHTHKLQPLNASRCLDSGVRGSSTLSSRLRQFEGHGRNVESPVISRKESQQSGCSGKAKKPVVCCEPQTSKTDTVALLRDGAIAFGRLFLAGVSTVLTMIWVFAKPIIFKNKAIAAKSEATDCTCESENPKPTPKDWQETVKRHLTETVIPATKKFLTETAIPLTKKILCQLLSLSRKAYRYAIRCWKSGKLPSSKASSTMKMLPAHKIDPLVFLKKCILCKLPFFRTVLRNNNAKLSGAFILGGVVFETIRGIFFRNKYFGFGAEKDGESKKPPTETRRI